MRVAVVSLETIHHRDADDTRRLQHLLRGLADRGHDVTVCCARWWDASTAVDGPHGAPAAPGSAAAATDADSAVTNDGALTTDASNADAATADASSDDAPPADSSNDALTADATDDESSASDALGPSAADPDDLPPAGNPTAGPTSEASGAAGAGPGHDDADDSVSTPEDVPTTITVDGITYRSVVGGPDHVREFATRVPLAVRKVRPDVIHALATPPAAVLGARAGATLARAPLLAEWYDPSRADADLWTTRQALARPRRIVTPSRLTRRQLLEHGAEDARLRVVPNAIDVEQIRSVEPVDGPDVVYARRLDEDANVESLLLGLAELRDRQWSATIVGDGPERAAYEQQVRDLRIDDRVTFAGALDREERLAIYRGAHAFVQTARHCVFATELLWALACGCVGVVEYHAESSAHELVEGRDRGFRTTNPQETAQAILDAGDLEQLTVDDAFEHFDRATVLEQYVGLYRELQEERGLL